VWGGILLYKTENLSVDHSWKFVWWVPSWLHVKNPFLLDLSKEWTHCSSYKKVKLFVSTISTINQSINQSKYYWKVHIWLTDSYTVKHSWHSLLHWAFPRIPLTVHDNITPKGHLLSRLGFVADFLSDLPFLHPRWFNLSFLCSILWTIDCRFVLFRLVIIFVCSSTNHDFGYTIFGTFKSFLCCTIAICDTSVVFLTLNLTDVRW
jgi:hypothetical protein